MKPILLIFALLFSATSFAQHKFLDVPKLSDKDVASTKSEIEPDAPAEVLYRSYHYRMDYEDGNMYKDVIDRVKIYNKDNADDFLNIEVMTYDDGYNNREVLSDLKAVTYNMENGKVTATKVDKNSKYKSVEDKNYIVNKFGFLNVKDGSVVEYSYSIKSPFWEATPRVFVEDEIPIRYFEFVFDTPIVIGYTIDYRGTLVPKYRDVKESRMYGFDYQTYRYGYENLQAFKKELFVRNNNDHKTSIKAGLNSVTRKEGITKYAVTWNDVRKTIYNHDDFGYQLKKTHLVKNMLPGEITNIQNIQEKAAAILKFVQNNYVYNEKDFVITDKGVKNLIDTKTGTSSEINLLLIMLLRNAGIDANPVALSTADRGMLLTYSPSLNQFNYVIAAFEDGGKTYLLDGTSKFTKINLLPPKVYNYVGILMPEKKDSKQIEITYPDLSETFLTIDAKMNADRSFEGHFSDRDTNLYALMVAEEYHENKEEFQKTYKDRYLFSFGDLQSGQKETGDFETSFDFDSDTFSDEIGNKIAFNPLLFLYRANHDYSQTEERRSPLEFVSRNRKVKKATITLPEGYAFENVPKSKKFRTEESEIQYSYIVTQKDNKLTVETAVTIDAVVFPETYYPLFKEMFDNITQMEAQVVTAVKK
ncbi:MAG: DUF3857 and transglutaminase domain-containing protein [Flavobacteriaceae bacterium]|nr:DUF3857 and transglutaminase domain-containing protein [Flavobacteriaceae bacterium]